MAMQKKTLVMGALFNKWTSQFILHISRMYGISNENRH